MCTVETILRRGTDRIRNKVDSCLDLNLLVSELKRACGHTVPGQDKVCYAELKPLPDNILDDILDLFNTIWNEGKLPSGRKVL